MIEIIILHALKSVKNIFLANCFVYKTVCIDDKFSKPAVLYRGKNELNYCKKAIRKHFNNNLVKSTKDEEIFQSSNKCWICNKLFDIGDNKVRDHCHVIGKYRGLAHRSCNINLRLTKRFL